DHWELVQDWELWMRLTARGDVLFVPDEIGWWRIHDSSPAYKRLNAREHLELAGTLERSLGALPPRRAAAAVDGARARAALMLDGAPARSAGGDDVWEPPYALPSVGIAEATLARTLRRVALTQTALRAAGVPRWLELTVRG